MSNRKVALVVHGMDALGTAICRRLQRDGYAVAATAPLHRCMPAAWLAAQRDDGFDFQGWCVDVGEPGACAALMDKLLASHGRLDVLVQVAAQPAEPGGARLHDLSQPHWRATRQMALDGAFNIGKLAVVPMLERRWGRIIQVLSPPAGPQPALADATAHAGLHGLCKALALEVARHGVTVNTIAPGYLRLDAALGDVARPAGNDLAAQIPVGRLGEAADIAALVSYLASDDAAFITGALLAINGGAHMS